MSQWPLGALMGLFGAIGLSGVWIIEFADYPIFAIGIIAFPVALLIAVARSAKSRPLRRLWPPILASLLVGVALSVASTDRVKNEIREGEEPPPPIARQAATAAPWCTVVVGLAWLMACLAAWDQETRREERERDEG